MSPASDLFVATCGPHYNIYNSRISGTQQMICGSQEGRAGECESQVALPDTSEWRTTPTYLEPPSLLSLPESICRWQGMCTRPSPGPTTGWSTAQSCLIAAQSVERGKKGRNENKELSELGCLWTYNVSCSGYSFYFCVSHFITFCLINNSLKIFQHISNYHLWCANLQFRSVS